jgi:hypothetical protein
MFVFVASVKDTLDPFADMLKLVFSEYIPELVFSERDRRSRDSSVPARNVPIVSVDAAEIVLFATIERVESGLHVRVTRDIQNASSASCRW